MTDTRMIREELEFVKRKLKQAADIDVRAHWRVQQIIPENHLALVREEASGQAIEENRNFF